MCGIFGEVRYEAGAGRPIGPALEAMRHRGPDASGEWSDGTCALGHQRLAIIDLSEAGRQPLGNEDGTVQVTFNGEIYNFATLRKELRGLGHRFRTRTDTEVIVHAYEQWGTRCVDRLRGMFAFAVWDQRRRRLYLARDRVGKKPLFYTRQTDRFLFASELQGLLADPAVPREVDFASLDTYLTYGYIPAPASAFRGVAKLPPAHWLTLDLRPGEPDFRVERYWALEYGPKLRLSEAEACEALRETLTEAVRLRMVSDVPLGAFLSGGIDSSIVVGLMARLSDRPVKTFSIGFEEAVFNELDHARRVADRWGTDHHPLVIRPDALAVVEMLARHFGEPYADSSAVPTYYVSQITRESVTVALNGDGGDESFAGYERYLAHRLAGRIGRVPGVRRIATALARALPDSTDPRNRVRRARRFLASFDQPADRRYARWLTFFRPEAKDRLYTEGFREQVGTAAPLAWLESLYGQAAGLDPVDAAMSVDVRSYLPFDLLVKVDITSMANSLEARSPFLDHAVMEFAARLPARYKLRGRTSKYLLKRAFADLLPPENVSRPKMGFGVPVGRWFRGPLRELLRDSLLSGRAVARGYFRPAEVDRLVNLHLEGRADHTIQLWNLLMLELWYSEMVAGPPGRTRRHPARWSGPTPERDHSPGRPR
jgi:asparagine synthase (glutamine-hydrolysing)